MSGQIADAPEESNRLTQTTRHTRPEVDNLFCDCGSLLTPLQEDGWECSRCGRQTSVAVTPEWHTSLEHQPRTLTVRDEHSAVGPTTEAHCPECGHDRAFWEIKQIRAIDESATEFYICEECEHRWREDDY